MPQVYYDGDYTVAQLVGPPEFEIPFKADPKPYAYQLPYWQFLNNYEDLPLGTAGPLGGIYVGGAAGNFKSIGGGIIEFRREFALVPDTRSEYESFIYDYHLQFFTFGFPDFCTQSSPLLVHSRLQFDYFATNDPNSIDLPRAFSILQTCLGQVLLGADNAPNSETPSGTEILAESGTLKVWKPGIYERKMRYIKWISASDLIFNDG